MQWPNLWIHALVVRDVLALVRLTLKLLMSVARLVVLRRQGLASGDDHIAASHTSARRAYRTKSDGGNWLVFEDDRVPIAHCERLVWLQLGVKHLSSDYSASA
jgi:hypothetical protein